MNKDTQTKHNKDTSFKFVESIIQTGIYTANTPIDITQYVYAINITQHSLSISHNIHHLYHKKHTLSILHNITIITVYHTTYTNPITQYKLPHNIHYQYHTSTIDITQHTLSISHEKVISQICV